MNEEKHHVTDLAEKEYHLTEKLIKNLELFNQKLGYWRSFWHGLVVALGSTVGFAVAIALISYILRKLSFIPGIHNSVEVILSILNGFSK